MKGCLKYGALAVISVLVLAVLGLVFSGGDDPEPATTSTAPARVTTAAPTTTVQSTTTTMRPTTTTTVRPTTTTRPATTTTRASRPLPRTCGAAEEAGWTASEFRRAWEAAGRPSKYDRDNDGIPCESL